MPNPSQKPPASSKIKSQNLKEMDDICNFEIKLERQNLKWGTIKDQWLYPNTDQDAKP